MQDATDMEVPSLLDSSHMLEDNMYLTDLEAPPLLASSHMLKATMYLSGVEKQSANLPIHESCEEQ